MLHDHESLDESLAKLRKHVLESKPCVYIDFSRFPVKISSTLISRQSMPMLE